MSTAAARGGLIQISFLTGSCVNWKIIGRCIKLGKVTRGEGKKSNVLHFCLMDGLDPKSTIRCTMFDDAITKFGAILRENHVYYLRNGKIRVVSKKFRGANQHAYELLINTNAEFTWVGDESYRAVPLRQRACYAAIANIKGLPDRSKITILAVLVEVKGQYELQFVLLPVYTIHTLCMALFRERESD